MADQCTFHPKRRAVLVDPHANEPVCQGCIDYRTCPVCQTVAPFGVWQCDCGAFQCAECGEVWVPTEPSDLDPVTH